MYQVAFTALLGLCVLMAAALAVILWHLATSNPCRDKEDKTDLYCELANLFAIAIIGGVLTVILHMVALLLPNAIAG